MAYKYLGWRVDELRLKNSNVMVGRRENTEDMRWFYASRSSDFPVKGSYFLAYRTISTLLEDDGGVWPL